VMDGSSLGYVSTRFTPVYGLSAAHHVACKVSYFDPLQNADIARISVSLSMRMYMHGHMYARRMRVGSLNRTKGVNLRLT